MKRKTAANASSDLNNNDDDNPEAENDDETTRRTNNSAMPNAPPESVAWLPPLDRLSFAEDDDDENSENNLSMRNERTYESKSGESAYTIARKDGKSTIDDENEDEFIEYKEKVERVHDVMEFISKNKNWLKIARTQKMREYRAKMGLVDARLDEEEEEDAATEGLSVPEAFEHETFLDERGNITGRALYVCITSFWLRVYYNLAQFELNASELDDIANRALVPKEKVSEWFEFARTNYNKLSAKESKEYYDCEMVKLKKFEQLVDEDFSRGV